MKPLVLAIASFILSFLVLGNRLHLQSGLSSAALPGPHSTWPEIILRIGVALVGSEAIKAQSGAIVATFVRGHSILERACGHGQAAAEHQNDAEENCDECACPVPWEHSVRHWWSDTNAPVGLRVGESSAGRCHKNATKGARG